MAQIFAFGRVENDLVPKKSQKDSTYVCFGFTEQTGKGQFQYYQVWAWDDEVSRLARLGVKKGSRLWITGTQQLVDCTAGHGKERTKILKIYLSNFGFLPGGISKEGSRQPYRKASLPNRGSCWSRQEPHQKFISPPMTA